MDARDLVGFRSWTPGCWNRDVSDRDCFCAAFCVCVDRDIANIGDDSPTWGIIPVVWRGVLSGFPENNADFGVPIVDRGGSYDLGDDANHDDTDCAKRAIGAESGEAVAGTRETERIGRSRDDRGNGDSAFAGRVCRVADSGTQRMVVVDERRPVGVLGVDGLWVSAVWNQSN